MAIKKKVFVLDTNVLLHDYRCIYNFQENNVIIPITVLEELDRFKKGNDIINYHAREFTRELDKLSGDSLFNGGVPLGKGLEKNAVHAVKFKVNVMETGTCGWPDHSEGYVSLFGKAFRRCGGGFCLH